MEGKEKIYYPCYEEDEIDLYELWLTLKKRKMVIFFTTLLFLSLAIIFIFISPKVFKINFALKAEKYMIGNSNFEYFISPYEIKYTINNLSYFLKEGRYKQLANLLSISPEDAQKLSSISVNIPRQNKDFVEITLESLDREILKKLQLNIALYIKNLPSIKRELEQTEESLRKEIDTLKSQINTLEKMKQRVFIKGDINDEDLKGIVELETLLKDLQEELIKKEIALKNIKPFTLIAAPFVPEKPYKPKKALILAVAIVSGLFLGIFLAFFLEWLDNVKKREQGLKSK